MRNIFACDECEYNPVLRCHLWQHYSVRHIVNKLQNERLHCDECDHPFQVSYSTMRSAQLRDHFARIHGSDAFRQQFFNFTCDECTKEVGRSFATYNRAKLTTHIAWNHGSAEFRDVAFGPRPESRVCDDCWKLCRGVASNFARHWNSSHAPVERRSAYPRGRRRLSDPSARCDDCSTEIVGRLAKDQFTHWLRSHANSSSGLRLAAEFRKKRKVQCDSCGVSIHRASLYHHWQRAYVSFPVRSCRKLFTGNCRPTSPKSIPSLARSHVSALYVVIPSKRPG